MQEVLIEDVVQQLSLLYGRATDLRAAYFDYATTVRGAVALAADGTDGQLHDINQQIGMLELAIGAVIAELASLKQQQEEEHERG
ncbi:hypothetical protein T45_08216 [Streptomyces turgidiscabies]|nr:hypothetical protein T45_08216 [Streptomyces turgidiscabies]